MILSAAQFLIGNQVFLEMSEFVVDRIHYLARGLERRSGVDREASRIAVHAYLGVDGVCESHPFADILEQPRAHAAAKEGVENVADETILVRQRVRGNTHI